MNLINPALPWEVEVVKFCPMAESYAIVHRKRHRLRHFHMKALAPAADAVHDGVSGSKPPSCWTWQ